jgi:hypothetical protein
MISDDRLPLDRFIQVFKGLERYGYDFKFQTVVDTIEEWNRTHAKPTTDLKEYGEVMVVVGLKLSGKYEKAMSFMSSLVGVRDDI